MAPVLSVTGDDTNIDLSLQTKGSGVYNFLSTASMGSEIRLYEDTDTGSNYIGLKAGTMSTDITYYIANCRWIFWRLFYKQMDLVF